eukprot:3951060-Alexandrium_andersonii.AAC.1
MRAGRRRALSLDAACWAHYDEATGKINGVVCGHVGDLLFTGDQAAYASFQELGAELGFGRVELNSFTWC